MTQDRAERALVRDVLADGTPLWQPRRGFRVGPESVVFADIVARAPAFARARRVVDLGAGSGVLGVLLHARRPELCVVAVELFEANARLCRRNFAERRLAGGVVVGDVAAPPLGAGWADLVVTNPPYIRAGSGRPSARDATAAATHELRGTLVDFLAAAAHVLSRGPDAALFVMYPPERLVDVARALAPHDLRVVEATVIATREDGSPHRLAIEARRAGDAPHGSGRGGGAGEAPAAEAEVAAPDARTRGWGMRMVG